LINPLEEVCFRLSRRALRDKRVAHTAAPTTAEYVRQRHSGLERQFTRHFERSRIVDKRVLDFGSGAGELSRLAWELGAQSVIGVDLSEKFVDFAREATAPHGLGDKVSFVVGEVETIPLPDATADVILCFDVMEHVLAYEAIIREWRRVLAPGGRVLICWASLWMHPYGHHCYPLVSVPWAHLALSEAAFLRVCARVYDMPEYQPSFWHLDEQGEKKPNPYVRNPTLGNYLNKLTTWEFERCCRRAGLQIARKEVVPFSGDRLRSVKQFLASVPYLSDAFCGRVVYELSAV
jgi:SAM-dependent methyltransferase